MSPSEKEEFFTSTIQGTTSKVQHNEIATVKSSEARYNSGAKYDIRDDYLL